MGRLFNDKMADGACGLLIFMDTEASHGNVYFGDIIELAAVVDPRVIKKRFHSLINTDQYLVPFGEFTFHWFQLLILFTHGRIPLRHKAWVSRGSVLKNTKMF